MCIVRGENGEAAVQEAMDLLGGMERVVDQGDRVLIKPNNVITKYVRGTVTSAEVVAAIALLVVEAGGKPIIGENHLVCDPSSPSSATSCGRHYYDALAQMELEGEAPLVDLMQDEMIELQILSARVSESARIARTALEVDKIIDVPVLKTHDQTAAVPCMKPGHLRGFSTLRRTPYVDLERHTQDSRLSRHHLSIRSLSTADDISAKDRGKSRQMSWLPR